MLLLLIAIGLAKYGYCFDEDIETELSSAQDDGYQKREDDFYKYEEKRLDMRRAKKKISKAPRTTTSIKNKEEIIQRNDENESDNVNLESGKVEIENI